MQTTAVEFEDFDSPVMARAALETTSQSISKRRMELEDLILNNLPRFRRLAMRWLRNSEDAEDAVQDAVLSAFNHIARSEGRSQMSTWLTAIVVNAVRMQLRRRPRCPIISIDQVSNSDEYTLADSIADAAPTPEQSLEQRELHELLATLIRNFPPSQRAALQVRGLGGLSTSEASEALGICEGTLKAQLARARAKLTQRLRRALGVPADQTSTYLSKYVRASKLLATNQMSRSVSKPPPRHIICSGRD
jgi:RNA polymerase sigma-70 factor (ECF subfamily)